MLHRASTPGHPSSKPETVKLTNFHLVISSFAALAGVTLAAYQALGPSSAPQSPITVTLAVPQEGAAANAVVSKSDAEDIIPTVREGLEKTAHFSAALNDGSDRRYDFGTLFDDKSDTFVTIKPPDSELNIFVQFDGPAPVPVTAIEYTPPSGISTTKLATTLDVIVVAPEDGAQAAGQQVFNFSLQTSPGSQTFAIPGHVLGTGMSLRIAGPSDGTQDLAVGDFRIIREKIAQ